MKPRRLFSCIFFLLIPLLAFSACGLQNVIATPTAWTFPSLTPRVTWTPYPTITGIPSATTHPTAPAAAGVGTPMPRVREILSVENAAQIELLARRGRGIPLLMRLSPDGERLGVATTRGVYLYDADTLQDAGAIETQALPTCLTFSDDGSLLAWGARDGSLHLWDTVQLAPLLEWRAGTLPVLSVAFSPAADQLAVSLWDKTVRLFRTVDGQQLYNWEVHLRPVTELSFSSSGELVLAWAYKESIQEWQVEDGQSVGTLYVGEDETGRLPVSAAFSSDRSLFASNHGMRIRLFRTRNGTTLRLFRDLDEEVRNLVLSPDGTRLAALEETHIQVWESESGERLGQVALSEESSSRLLMAFNLTGDVLYTLGDALQAWRIGEGGELVAERSAEFASSNLLAAVLQEEPAALFTGSMNGVLRKYALDVGSLEQSQTLADDTLESLALAPSSGLAAGAGTYSDTRLWHNADPALATVIAGQDGRVTCLAFSVDGSMLASGAEDQTVAVWDSQDA